MTAAVIICVCELLFQMFIFGWKFLTVGQRRLRDTRDGRHGALHRYGFELFRGLIERSLLTLGLVSGVPQVLIPFGVLKLQNRIGLERDGDDDQREAARAYFLVGNLLTIGLSIVYAHVLVRVAGVDVRLLG